MSYCNTLDFIMTYDHHIMAKTCSDVALSNWRNGEWANTIISNQVRSVGSQSSFPSPDATFFDDKFQRVINFEFKPPSETKRGMLTSIGQALAYLNNSNLSFIFCPESVDGFNISNYFKDLFQDHIVGKLPIGLISYENDNPSKITELVSIEPSTILSKKINSNIISDRYWAKHQDLPNEVLFALLDKAFVLPDTQNRKHEVWKSTWVDYIFDKMRVLNTLNDLDPHIFYHYGTPFQLGKKKKSELRKKVKNGKITENDALAELKHWADPDRKGDCYSESYKKNFMTFIGHLELWDDACRLTPSGYELHKIGKIYGPNSKMFLDALIRIVLFSGRHLDLIMDLWEFSIDNREKTLPELANKFTDYYANQGKIKFNPNRRKKTGQNEQFRFELIFWRKFNLLAEHYSSDGPLEFNFREISRICASNL